MKFLAFVIILLPVVCFGASVVRTIDAPDTNISGLAWGGDRLWALDEGSSMIYGINPVTGSIEVSFEVLHPSCPTYSPAGLAYHDGTLFSSYVSGNSSSYIYFYNDSGSYLGYDLVC